MWLHGKLMASWQCTPVAPALPLAPDTPANNSLFIVGLNLPWVRYFWRCAHLLHRYSQQVLYCQLPRTRLHSHQRSRPQVRDEAAWRACGKMAVHTCGACTATCAGHACKQDTSVSLLNFILMRILCSEWDSAHLLHHRSQQVQYCHLLRMRLKVTNWINILLDNYT